MSAAWKDVVETSGARFYWLLAGLCSTLVTARYLGPDGRGVVAAALAWVNLFTTAGFLSLPQVVPFFSIGRRNEVWLPSVAGTLLIMTAAATAISWAVALALTLWPGAVVFGPIPGRVLVVAFAAIPFVLWMEGGNSILTCLGRLRALNLAIIVAGTVNIGLVLALVGFFRRGVVGALVAILVAQMLASSIGFRSIRQDATEIRFSRRIAAGLLASGARLHLQTVGAFLVLQSGVLLLNHFRTSAETAYYQLALQFVAAIQVLPLAVSTVAYSILSKEGADEGWKEHRRLVVQVIVAISVISVVAFLAAPMAVRILVGHRFLPTVGIFRTLLLGMIGMTMSVVMACQWISRGFFLRAALLTAAGGVTATIANWLLIPRYGAQGAAWVMVAICGISMLVNGAMMLWVERRWRNLRTIRRRDARTA